jgi:hypothetical protein
MDFSSGAVCANKDAGVDRVQSEFAWNGGSCVELDKLIKKVRDKAVAERLSPSPYNYGQNLADYDRYFKTHGLGTQMLMKDFYLQALVDHRANLEMAFASNNCSDKIETLRQKESGVLITKTAIQQEKTVLGSSEKEQNIYIGIGALTLLIGLIILVKK